MLTYEKKKILCIFSSDTQPTCEPSRILYLLWFNWISGQAAGNVMLSPVSTDLSILQMSSPLHRTVSKHLNETVSYLDSKEMEHKHST